MDSNVLEAKYGNDMLREAAIKSGQTIAFEFYKEWMIQGRRISRLRILAMVMYLVSVCLFVLTIWEKEALGLGIMTFVIGLSVDTNSRIDALWRVRLADEIFDLEEKSGNDRNEKI